VVRVLEVRTRQRGADAVAEAGFEGGGDAERLRFRQFFRGGEDAGDLLGEEGQGAEAPALEAVGVGVEAVHRFLDRGEGADVAGGDGDQAALDGGKVGADLVLLDHGGERGGEIAAFPDEGGDAGVAVLAGFFQLGAEGEQAAEAGEQAVALPVAGFGEGVDLDGLAQAGGGDREPELLERLGVEAGAVAGERALVDLGEGDQLDVHGVSSGQGWPGIK
jgi:hypothetical protein